MVELHEAMEAIKPNQLELRTTDVKTSMNSKKDNINLK